MKFLFNILNGILISKKFFNENIDQEKRRQIFAKNVKMVEIETFSFCNRQCWFCPNSQFDRHSNNVMMKEDLYIKILRELSEISYDGKISFSRYNEPLANEVILKRIEQARKILPKSYLHINTNGDYLNREYLEKLSDAGLNSINVQTYLNEKEIYSNELIAKKSQRMIKKLALNYKVIKNKKNEIYQISFDFPKMKSVMLQGRNFAETGTNRGGLLKKIRSINRIHPCFMTFSHFYIDFNGNTVPCCNFRSDVNAHKFAIIGDCNKNSIFEIFFNKKIIQWRRSLWRFGKKKSPCDTCNFAKKSIFY